MRIAAAASHLREERAATLSALQGATLQLIGDPELFDRAERWLAQRMAAGRDGGGFVDLGAHEAYLKGGPLRGRAAWRHGFALALSDREPPRRREFDNLTWLRKKGFDAAEPLLAVSAHRRGRVIGQCLLTTRVERAGNLRPLLESGRANERRWLVIEHLAREVARLHAFGFLHGDLYPRNILHAGTAERPLVVFLDAWRGGPRQARPLAAAVRRDLGAFFLHGAEWLERDEQAHFLALYLARLAEAGEAIDRGHALSALAIGRKRERRRFASDPSRRRGLPMPREGWKPPKPALLTRRG